MNVFCVTLNMAFFCKLPSPSFTEFFYNNRWPKHT